MVPIYAVAWRGETRMISDRRKDGDKYAYEFSIDWRFWSLPLSICHVPTPAIGNTLAGGGVVCFRFLCLQLAIEWWNWTDEVTDINNSVEEILNG